MTSIGPVNERNHPGSIREDPSMWDKIMDQVKKLDRATRASAAATLEKTAALIEAIANDPDKIEQLLQSLKRIENISCRGDRHNIFNILPVRCFTLTTSCPPLGQ